MPQWERVPTAPEGRRESRGGSRWVERTGGDVGGDNRQGGASNPSGPSANDFNRFLNLGFFVADLVVTFGGLICLFASDDEPFQSLNDLYLVLFGAFLIVLDAPLNFKAVLEFKGIAGKYCRILGRLTGKGLWLIFLGCMLFSSLWDRGTSTFCAIVLGLSVIVLGCLATAQGLIKSRKLNQLRVSLMELKKQDSLEANLSRFAVSNAASAKGEKLFGLTKAEFATMASEVCAMKFDSAELNLTFNALTAESTLQEKDILTIDNVEDWTDEGPMVLL